jgi:hypothetical protein
MKAQERLFYVLYRHILQNIVFWNITPCSLTVLYSGFGKKITAASFKVNLYQAVWRHITEVGVLQ